MDAMDTGELLDVRQVSKLLHVSQRTTYTLIERGFIPRLKIGRCARFRQADVVRYISSLQPTPIKPM